MRKIFISFMMLAAAMLSFTSCSKSDDDNPSVSNAFKLDGNTYDLGCALAGKVTVQGKDCTMLLIRKSENDISDAVGFIFLGGEIQTGDMELSVILTETTPMLLAMTGNGTTSIDEMLKNAYFATEGSAKITGEGNNIRITTSGVKMTNEELVFSGETVDFELYYDGTYSMPVVPTPPTEASFTIDGESHDIKVPMLLTSSFEGRDFSIAFFCENDPAATDTTRTNVVALLSPAMEFPAGTFDVHIDPVLMLPNVAYMTDVNIIEFLANPKAAIEQSFMGTEGTLYIEKDGDAHYNISSENIVVTKGSEQHDFAIKFNGELQNIFD